MRATEIKVGHIYYVDFEPTRKGEFDRHHLALVLKKTVSEITFIVVPLIGNSDGTNKIKLNISDKLPPHLQKKNTYAVYDQVRTLNASRFQNLYEGDEIYEVALEVDDIDRVLEKIIINLLGDLSKERIGAILSVLH